MLCNVASKGWLASTIASWPSCATPLAMLAFAKPVLSHQRSHGISLQTARTDLRKLASRGWLLHGKDGRREVFRVPENLAAMLPL